MDHQIIKKQWYNGVRIAHVAHIEAAKVFERRHIFLGVPVVILTTAVGTTVFAGIAESSTPIIKISVGIVSVIVAVLAGLQTFLRFSETAEKHRMASTN